MVQCINNKESVPYIHLKHVCSSELEINDPKESKKGSLKQEPKRIKLSNYLACYVSETISQPVINLLDYKAIWSAIQSKKSQGSTKELPELPFEELVKKFEKGRQRKVKISIYTVYPYTCVSICICDLRRNYQLISVVVFLIMMAQ